jgi:methyltransferase (TIGR00027 family)
VAPTAGGELSARAPLGDVSDTARWVAYFRALETERPDSLFQDPHARRLAGDRGRAIAENLTKGHLSWSLAVRTRVFDEVILDSVQNTQIDAVLNLAAGLDTRPYRLPLPADLRWVEVDLAGIISWKNEALVGERPACALERIPLDLTIRGARQDLLARLSAEVPRVLVVTEGFLAYLDSSEVASLADDLVGFFPKGLWLLENVAPFILARMQRMWGKTLHAANAEMKFAPADGLAFFRAHGWQPRVIKSLVEEADHLRRRPVSWLVRRLESLFPRRQEIIRKAVVYALMEPAQGDSGRSPAPRPE